MNIYENKITVFIWIEATPQTIATLKINSRTWSFVKEIVAALE